jgi:ATP-dependent DNA helicase DinG
MATADNPLIQIEQTLPKKSNGKRRMNLQTNFSPNLRDHFPFEEVRPSQDVCLTEIEESYTENKKFTICEAPTGTGKSGFGIAAASWAKTKPHFGGDKHRVGGYILSPQKTLTAQYMSDFEEMGLVELKGKANYWCSDHDTDCDTGALLNKSSNQGDDRTVCESCPYKFAKRTMLNSGVGTMNFAYFLNETQYAGQLGTREMLVCDEGHNLEQQILGFTDTQITRKRAEEVGVGQMPFIKPGENAKCFAWLTSTFRPALIAFMQKLEDELESAKVRGLRDEAVKAAKKLDSYDKYTCRLNRFINSEEPDNWLCWTDKDKGTMIIKPLTATLFADEVLFSKANKILVMSATILDFATVMRNLGIKREDANIVKLGSEFPLENRPIFFWPCGSMSAKFIDETMPHMADGVLQLMNKYALKKGIVHCHSYKITKYLVEFLTSRGLGHRIITHDSEPGSREAAVARHLESPDPTVLFSPSMTEGLDLKEDLSRFQIICKVPYPFLDPYVKARLARDEAWYNWQTALTLVQATGRSVRSKTDKAHTYILDSAFEYFLTKNQHVLPTWWTDSIQFLPPKKGVPIQKRW